MKLTNVDKKILESYIPVLEGLSNYMSSCYEFVLHSLEDYEHSVICIINGEHTNRQVGAPITDLALWMLDKIKEGKCRHISYFSHNKKGEPLKSTTIAICGENDRIIGLLCINMYLNSPLSDLLEVFSPTAPSNLSGSITESFGQDANDMIRTALEEERSRIMNNSNILPSNRNKIIVEHLYERGIFQVKSAVETVSKMLGISKNTVYMHLRNTRAAEKNQDTQQQA